MRTLRVLFVEDQEDDMELLLRELRRGGYSVVHERVADGPSLRAALGRRSWDVCISDWNMPSFDAPAALAIVSELAPDLPFIIVSGTVGEDIAVAAMRSGAHDFITKGRLVRLIPAIERELREAAIRRDQRRLQEQLVISDRMASVGTLAAGVAHEINNPLAALIANLDFACEDLDKLTDTAKKEAASGELLERFDAVAGSLKDARECSERVRNIVRDLKIFSRAGDEEPQGAVDLRRVVESSLRMAWNEIRHRARLVKDYGEVPPVTGSESRLGQVFLNLIINAAQAIPEGRTDRNEIRIRLGMADASRVIVEIADSGTGIAPEHLPRIFDAFFTTKPVGVGTGLGLAICHRIVTAIGGEISVKSDPGVGTAFRILLPVATVQPALAPPRRPSFGSIRRARILVIDDEPMIGAAVRRMLSSEHEIIAVDSADEALERIRSGERFDVILCDLMMPHVTGMDLHNELAQIAPDVMDRVVFMTGGAFTQAARQFLGEVSNPCLEKPFDGGSLRIVVQSVLR